MQTGLGNWHCTSDNFGNIFFVLTNKTYPERQAFTLINVKYLWRKYLIFKVAYPKKCDIFYSKYRKYRNISEEKMIKLSVCEILVSDLQGKHSSNLSEGILNTYSNKSGWTRTLILT